ncbi:MAG: S49 family peptidase [Smithella sp.]
MKVSDFAENTIWAIRPEALEALTCKFEAFQPDTPAMEAAVRLAVTSTPAEYEVRDGVAIIPIDGEITKSASFWAYIFGLAVLDDVQSMLTAAQNDPKVKAIVLDINSPGGTIDGVDALSQAIFSTRGQKPVVAFSGGQIASAAYWIGSAADTVIIDSTAIAGSIGVMTEHRDRSEQDKMSGVKRTYISSGKYKTLANDAEPLSIDGRQMLQDMTDQLYTLFVDAVARNKGVSAETVLSNMADGRLFIGKQAVTAGLADAVGTIETAIALARGMADDQKQNNQIQRKEKLNMNKNKILAILGIGKDEPVTIEALAEYFPDQIGTMAKTAFDKGAASINVEDQIKAAVNSGQETFMAVAGAFFGEANMEKFKTLVSAGMSPEQIKTLGITAQPAGDTDEEKKKKDELLAQLKASGAGNPGAGEGGTATAKDFTALVTDYQQEHKCGRSTAIKAIANAYPAVHAAFIASVNAKKKE